MNKNTYVRPNLLIYRFVQIVAFIFSAIVFKRKMLRNEIKNVNGPFVVIANHQCAYDFVNLIGAAKRPMTFVLSNSFYNSLPFKGIFDGLGVIPKQQFQTSISEMKRIKAVIDNGEALVIYPAGLMCEDGLSTPIPRATYKFLKWLGADVYAARTSGSYFAMPKWTSGFRPGVTNMDIYKLFDSEELAKMSVAEVKARTEEAMLFDAYREQEKLKIKYSNNDDINGLEDVLYMCPNCDSEFSMRVKDRSTIYCMECGFEETSDEYALLHNSKGIGGEVRYVSDWSRRTYDKMKSQIEEDGSYTLTSQTAIQMLDRDKHKFVDVGSGTLTVSPSDVRLVGTVNGESFDLNAATVQFPSLPFKPGKYLEIQHQEEIYRCVLQNGRHVMKYINLIKAAYELHYQKMELI